MGEIWKSSGSKFPVQIGLYHGAGDEYAFFSRMNELDFTVFVSEADIINLLEKLRSEMEKINQKGKEYANTVE